MPTNLTPEEVVFDDWGILTYYRNKSHYLNFLAANAAKTVYRRNGQASRSEVEDQLVDFLLLNEEFCYCIESRDLICPATHEKFKGMILYFAKYVINKKGWDSIVV